MTPLDSVRMRLDSQEDQELRGVKLFGPTCQPPGRAGGCYRFSAMEITEQGDLESF